MTTPKPWQKMTPEEKQDAVLPLIRAGESYAYIAKELAAPNRHCIAGIVSRLRGKGDLPPPPSKKATGAAGGALIRARARKSRETSPPDRKVKSTEKRPRVNVEPARSPAKIIALPGATPHTAASMIAAYIAANGVRRFETGISDDLDALRGYVARHGYEIAYTQRGRQPYQIRGGRGRPRSLDRTGLFAFVDELRIADGLEPFLPRKETADA